MSRMGIVRVTRHARRVLRFYLLVISLCMLFLVLRIVSSGFYQCFSLLVRVVKAILLFYLYVFISKLFLS